MANRFTTIADALSRWAAMTESSQPAVRKHALIRCGEHAEEMSHAVQEELSPWGKSLSSHSTES